ncbi:MAG: hypothetical protein ACP59X_11345 [Solidesulfovibrio sp. DCME]|uniref:hypothetical protein n=1 Tax=Solidesulfovibrio sp. DCME TaxID=3447380 RepID=UPI003D0C74B6
MRITGQGGGGAQNPGDRDRSDPEAFRRGRKVGQTVRGRLLGPGPGGLFWVVVAGHKLLAALDHEPVPGRELVFRIASLAPELVLKDITPPPSAASDPSLLLAGLTESRSRFERRLAGTSPPSPRAWPPGPPLDLTAARRRFAAFLATDAAARADYEALRLAFAQTASLIPAKEGRPVYAPWVFPGLAQSEILAARHGRAEGGPGYTLRICGRLEAAGFVAAIATWRPGQAVYRLMLERPGQAEALRLALSAIRFGRAEIAPACLTAGELPAELASGFLAKALAVTARPFTGLRLRV